MTEFDHKSDKDNSKPQSGGDPLLELTRLFGSRPRLVPTRVSFGGESQHTKEFDSYERDVQETYDVQNPVMMPEYGIEAQEEVAQPNSREDSWYEDDMTLLPYDQAGESPEFEPSLPFDESLHVHETQWTGTDWEEDVPLEPPPFFTSDMPASPPSHLMKKTLQLYPSEVSNASFGYGHSVYINPQIFSLPRMSDEADMMMPPPHPTRLEDASPPSSLEMEQMPQTSIAPDQEPLAAVLDLGHDDLDRAVPDFGLTFQDEQDHYMQPQPTVEQALQSLPIGEMPIGEEPVEEIDHFELPGVPYDKMAGGEDHHPHSTSIRTETPVAATQEKVSPPTPPPQLETPQAIIYDWGEPRGQAGVAKKVSGRIKWLYGLLVIVLLMALGAGGYLVFEYYQEELAEPVDITADPDEVRIIPQEIEVPQSVTSQPAIYDQEDENDASGDLLDSREIPLNIEQMEARPPLSNESSLDPQSLEENILQALSRAVPVHFVPTIIMRRDREGNLVDVSSNHEASEMIFRPGADYQASVANARAMQAAAEAQEGVQVAREREDDTLSRQVQEARLPADPDGRNSTRDTSSPLENMGSGTGNVASAMEPIPPSDITAHVIPSQKPLLQENISTGLGATNGRSPSSQVSNDAQIRAIQASEGDFYVQIASQPTQAAAQQSANEAQQRFASIIGGRQILIVPADIPGRGIYYRVRIATGERSAAINLCEQYKQAGGSCFIGR